MADFQLADRIVVSKDVLHGKPRIKGTRILVSQILDMLGAGKSTDEVISEDYFPDLTLDDVTACIRYASHVVKSETVVPTL